MVPEHPLLVLHPIVKKKFRLPARALYKDPTMTSRKGIIVLMGSGELTATMVKVHQELLNRISDSPKAVFMDTPAGFQLNVDLISQRAQEYFRQHVQQNLIIASLKSKEATPAFELEQAYHTLREADYVLIGPGSPTYAVRQLSETPVPEILTRRIENGGCLVAASAAALTVGRFTLPVYEIYKVGQDLHWVGGMDILHHFGFNIVVIPHWNNAEGGNHDTRFCFMGEPRFKKLESLLPTDVAVFGMDEHTACIIDLGKEEGEVKGIGRIVLRRGHTEVTFEKGDRFPLDILRESEQTRDWKPIREDTDVSEPESRPVGNSFWETVHHLENTFRKGLESQDSKAATGALLELDRTIWQAQNELEDEETISEAREILRDLLVLTGMALDAPPTDRTEYLSSLVEKLLTLRETFRKNKEWEAADAIRNCLHQADVVIEDTKDGPRWHLGGAL
jgi:peptidase E